MRKVLGIERIVLKREVTGISTYRDSGGSSIMNIKPGTYRATRIQWSPYCPDGVLNVEVPGHPGVVCIDGDLYPRFTKE